MNNKWEKQPYVRRHVHLWKISKDVPATKPGYDSWYGSSTPTPTHRKLTRECDGCGLEQSAEVSDESVLVKGYEAVADLPWE